MWTVPEFLWVEWAAETLRPSERGLRRNLESFYQVWRNRNNEREGRTKKWWSDSGENIGECRRLETMQLEGFSWFQNPRSTKHIWNVWYFALCTLQEVPKYLAAVVVRVSGLQWVVGNTNSYSCYYCESKRCKEVNSYFICYFFPQVSGQGSGFSVGFSFKLFIIIIYCMSLSLFLVNGANANFVDFHQIQCFQRLHDQIKRKKDYFQFVQLLSQQPFLTERAFNKLRLVQSC